MKWMPLRRRGAIMILIVGLLGVFMVSAAITIDYAYMGLVRTQLRIATDAAAKAGAEALLASEATDAEQQVSAARSAAVEYALRNRVAGEPLQIRPEDVSVGRLVWEEDGSWQFEPEGTPANAVRVDSRTGGDALHRGIPLFFSRFLGRETFTPRCSSLAGQRNIAICLCIDRSGSMLFDMSGVNNVFPPDNPQLRPGPADRLVRRQQTSPPHPTASRWAAVRGAIDLFLQEVGRYAPPPRTGLVTWGSNYTHSDPPLSFQAATTDVAVPSRGQDDWQANLRDLDAAITRLSEQPMMGATELSQGLEQAIEALNASDAASAAHKVIILMTDGVRTDQGRDPLAVAAQAKAAGITVHTVSMLTGYQQELEAIAAQTGGRHFMTSDEAGLRQAFEKLARSQPVVLVQ